MDKRRWLGAGMLAVVAAVGGMATSCGEDDGELGTPTASSTGTGGGGEGGVGHGGAAGGGASGAGGSAASGGSGASGGPPCEDFGEPCSQCTLSHCPSEFCACAQSDPCMAFAACYLGCSPGDLGCVQQCAAESPSGISAAMLVQHCAGSFCASVCPGTAPLGDCEVCLFQSCPTAVNACFANAECFQIIVGCLPTTPWTTCIAGVSYDVLALAFPVHECGEAACSAQCNWQ